MNCSLFFIRDVAFNAIRSLLPAVCICVVAGLSSTGKCEDNEQQWEMNTMVHVKTVFIFWIRREVDF